MQFRLVLVFIMATFTLVGSEEKMRQAREIKKFISYGLDDMYLGSALRVHRDPAKLTSLIAIKILANDLDRIEFSQQEKITGRRFDFSVYLHSIGVTRLLAHRVKLITEDQKKNDKKRQLKIPHSYDDIYVPKSLRLHKNFLSMTAVNNFALLSEDRFHCLRAAREVLRPRSEMSAEELRLEERRNLEATIRELEIVPAGECYPQSFKRVYNLSLMRRKAAGEDVSMEPRACDLVEAYSKW